MIYLVSGRLEVNSTQVEEGWTTFLTDENTIELVSKHNDSSFILIETVM